MLLDYNVVGCLYFACCGLLISSFGWVWLGCLLLISLGECCFSMLWFGVGLCYRLCLLCYCVLLVLRIGGFVVAYAGWSFVA